MLFYLLRVYFVSCGITILTSTNCDLCNNVAAIAVKALDAVSTAATGSAEYASNFVYKIAN